MMRSYRRILQASFCLSLAASITLAFATTSSVSFPSRRLEAPLANDAAITRGGAFKIPSGGALRSTADRSDDKATASYNEDLATKKRGKKRLTKVIVASATIALAAWKRDFLIGILQSASNADLRGLLIERLDALDALGMTGIIIYTAFFALWEMVVGVTTPVETAAGMAFGVKRGIIANAVGKVGGAACGFLIGRFLLFDYVSKKLKDNEMMDLVQESIQRKPIRVALVWRFSFLPEQIKVYGLSVLPLAFTKFLAAVILHGLPFTVLWTCMGAEAGALARGIVTTPSELFKLLVIGVYIFGFFISPAMVGLN